VAKNSAGKIGSTCNANIKSDVDWFSCSANVRVQRSARQRRAFRDCQTNAVRLQLHALAYNLANFLRTLAMPEPIEDWSLSSLKEKLIKIGAKVISHGRTIAFQMAEEAISRHMLQEFLRLIAELRSKPLRDKIMRMQPS
jgi:hypothetical protein